MELEWEGSGDSEVAKEKKTGIVRIFYAFAISIIVIFIIVIVIVIVIIGRGKLEL